MSANSTNRSILKCCDDGAQTDVFCVQICVGSLEKSHSYKKYDATSTTIVFRDTGVSLLDFGTEETWWVLGCRVDCSNKEKLFPWYIFRRKEASAEDSNRLVKRRIDRLHQSKSWARHIT
jgi:hypothetical protein